MKNTGLVVKRVLDDSIAYELGIEEEDYIISINGEYIRDIFDYQFLIIGSVINVCFRKSDGELWEAEIEKEEYDDLGIEFDEDTQISSQSCKNKCIFCFIDQLPKNMRETLYFKDDDSRMSFLLGNYITMTNMNNSEIERIIAYKMSPLNISVHTTNSDLRILMMRNKNAGDLMKKLRRLAFGGIEINCQIVLCKGINDGHELDRTINDLVTLYPKLNSISVVPVGLTKFRSGLSSIEPYTADECRDIIKQVEKKQKVFYKKHKSRIVFLADELYIKAGIPLPSKRHYENFPQLENGVGLMTLFKSDFKIALKRVIKRGDVMDEKRKISVATGVSAYKEISGLCQELTGIYPNMEINVFELKNDFFGENITVAGLLTGKDISEQLAGKELGEMLLLSSTMFKNDENIFLDDMSIKTLSDKLGVPVEAVENSGEAFLQQALGIKDYDSYLMGMLEEIF